MMRRLFVIIILLSITVHTYGQSFPSFTGDFEKISLLELSMLMEEQTGYPFYFDPSQLDSLFYSGSFKATPIDEALRKVLNGTIISFSIFQDAVFLTQDVSIIQQLPIESAIRAGEAAHADVVPQKGLLFSQEYLNQTSDKEDLENYVFEIGARKEFKAGGTSTVAGYLRQADTGEPLGGAAVYTDDFSVTSSSDENGFYSITLPNGKNTLLFQYVGMKPARRNIVLFSNGQLNVEMNVDVIALQEITIESDRMENIQTVAMGVSKIDVAKTKNVPILLGERDIMKVATTMAGVQKVGEGASGFNVRGGKSDQNLILFNNATIFNASHFFGFFSVFNSDGISDMNIYKSSIPANFGGRLSSVFDITAKASNKREFTGTGGISPVTSKLTLDIPILKGKSGLVIGGRSTYSNWLLKRINNADFSENRVSFADLMMNYDHQLNENNVLRITGYYSRDQFRITSDSLFSFSDFKYINANTSTKWTHHFSNALTGELAASYAGYQYELSFDESLANAFRQDFEVEEFTANGDLSYYRDNIHTLKAGIEVKQLIINPGTKSPLGSASEIKPIQIATERGIQNAIYLSDQFIFTPNLTLDGGIRYSLFTLLGPQTVYNYDSRGPLNENTRLDSTKFSRGQSIKTYHGPEFRFSGRYQINSLSSVKASFTRMRQYVHTLTNSASLSPTDTWRLSNPFIKPQISDQYSLGYYRNFRASMFETSLEVYYKSIQNLLDFKVGADFLLNPYIETIALQGPGKSYGAEISIKKSGKLNGWVNYTFARTFIRLKGNSPEETINRGQFFPANYDIPHTINLVANYKLTHRLSFSYNFTFNSGRPVTYPVGEYSFRGIGSVHYTDRNAYRIPYYMRMDLGANLEAGHKLNKLAYSYWSFSIYNLLARDNPYSVYFDIKDGNVNGYQLIIFGNAIPTISYNFRF